MMLREFQEAYVPSLIKDDSIIPDTTGIYLYLDEDTGKYYIGKSVNLRKRFRQHLNNQNVKNARSFDYNLQTHPEHFYYRVLIYGVDPSILDSLETTYIERYNAVSDGYNMLDVKDTFVKPVEVQSDSELAKLYTKLRRKYLKLVNENLALQETIQNLQNHKN